MRSNRAIAWVAVCTLLLGACSDITGTGGEAARLKHNRQLWKASGVQSYSITIWHRSMWFGGRVRYEVRDGVLVSVTRLDGYAPPASAGVQDRDVVEELFATVERAIKNKADRLEVTYIPHYGIPSSLDVDPRLNVADDEHGFTVEDFRVLR